MFELLHSPVPFVYGLDSRFFDHHDQPSDVVPVDLDTNTISLGSNFAHLSSKLLPKRAARFLKNRLAALQEKSLQHSKFAQRLEMENDDSIDFEFKVRARENALQLEIVQCQDPCQQLFHLKCVIKKKILTVALCVVVLT